MSLFDLAKDALKEIPMADVMRARLELAFDQSALQEKQISALREENAELKAEFKIARREAEKNKAELDALRRAHSEQVEIRGGIEYRVGKRTNGAWKPFCPKCHLPLHENYGNQKPHCLDRKCGWNSTIFIAGGTYI